VGICIADGAPANRLWCKDFFTLSNPHNDVDDIGLATYMQHPCSGREVYFCPDPSHVIKKLVSSLSNQNHFIYKNDPAEPTVESHTRLTLDALYKIFMSFEDLSGGPRMFRFRLNHFIKTNFEKMRVSPCLDIFGPMMEEMLRECDRREALYEDSEKTDKRYASYEKIHLLTVPFLDLIAQVSSVFDILGRRKYGLSVDYKNGEELDVFRNAAKK
jgi:hypothetical protein